MFTFSKSLRTIAVATCCLIPMTHAVSAEQSQVKSLQLKTSIEEVNGVREIETGNYPAGIKKTLAALSKKTVPAQRAPFLTNLCVARIATGELVEAQQVCDNAVAASNNNAIALNNRAVLNYVNDNIAASREDLELAHAKNRYNRMIQSNLSLIKQPELLVSN